MIDLYTWSTPNGRKVTIMLEEVGLPYKLHKIDITKNEQFQPDFLKISPNNRIPAIVDPEGPGGKPLSLFESGAILLYLADKTGQFLAKDGGGRYTTLQWLMWQMGGVGPMFGQNHHFRLFAPEKVPYAIERYTNETKRLYGVLNHQLAHLDYVAGDYSIADMALYPWTMRHEAQGIILSDFPHVKAWRDRLELRPALMRGMTVF
jgi:GST-like protein